MDDKLTEDKSTKEKLTEKNWFILLVCIIFFPVGVYLLWVNGKFSTVTKVIITVFQTIFFSLFLAALITPFVIDLGTTDTTPPSTSNRLSYRVVEINESPYVYAKRYSWRVVVDKELNSTELEQVAKEVIEEAKKSRPFNALTVFLYDHEEYINYNATLGQATFAPNGDWGQADTVAMGEYDKMDYSYDIYEKDWSKKLTDDEIQIYATYNKAMTSAYESDQAPDEYIVKQSVGEQFGVSREEVKQILDKQTKWSVNNIK